MAQGKILIVEDESVVRSDIAEVLVDAGYTVAGEAARGEDVVRLVEETAPDLILMDIKLEGAVSGIEAANSVRERFGTPVIYLTAYADDTTLAAAKVTEPYGYVLKPYKPLELRTAIEIALHRTRKASHQKEKIAVEELSDSGKEDLALLRSLEIFSETPEDELAMLLRGASTSEYRSGEIITDEGSEGGRGLLVKKGRVSLVKTSLKGKDFIVDSLSPDDPFGLVVALDSSAFSYALRAQLDTSVLWIRRSDVLSVLHGNPALEESLLALVFDRLRRAHVTSHELATQDVKSRIAGILYRMWVESSQNRTDEPVLYMTRAELAELAGTTEETAIRVTKGLEREGVLCLPSPGVILVDDLEKLLAVHDHV